MDKQSEKSLSHSSSNESSEYGSKYQQIQLIGKNYQDDSKLYLVRDTIDRKYKLAKKLSIFECSNNDEDKLLNEIGLLKQINHPHIVKYYDVCLEGDVLIAVLQFCEEGDMHNYLHKRKARKQTLSEKLIICWLMQLLMGLEHIHTKNIVHRLVASHNVYMNHQGDLKLGSFGSAKVLENTIKKAMSLVTEPCNMSPEMVEGNPYDCKADIWALGCLVYEMATFTPMFKFGNLAQLYDLIVEKPCPQLPGKYSKYLAPILRKMMKKNPQQRPSATELLQEQVFIKLMKEYVKKKKIDSLDLKYIVPKQLNVHKKKKNEEGAKQSKSQVKGEAKKQKIKLPPLVSTGSPPLNGFFSKSNSVYEAKLVSPKDKQTNPKKDKLSSIDKPPPLKKETQSLQTNSTAPTAPTTPKHVSSSDQDSKESDSQRQPPERLTSANLDQGAYISTLCELKLELILKKYQPNMSMIYEQTMQFQDLL